MNDFRQWQEAVRLGYDINDKVKVSFTYRRLDSYFEYPTPYVDYNQWPSVPDPHLYNTEDKNRSNLVTGRVDAEISSCGPPASWWGITTWTIPAILPDLISSPM